MKPKPLAAIFEDLIHNADDTALDSLNLKLSELAIRNEITTHVQCEIPTVLALNRQLLAQHIILKWQFRDIEKIICERAERKTGKRNVLKGKTVVSMPEVLEELKRYEMERDLKKKKQRTEKREKQAKVIQEVESTSEEDEEAVEIEVLDVIAVQSFSS